MPNAVGLVLGSAQLILYSIYKKKPGSEKSDQDTEKEEEEVSAHLVKGGGGIEMRQGYDDGSRNRVMLNKGSSLPKPSIIRQYSIKKLVKALSMSPYESHSGRSHEEEEEDDSRNGDLEGGKNGGC